MGLVETVERSTLGDTMSSVAIQKGLLELNPDIHFDMPNKLGEAGFVFSSQGFETINANRQGIYWNGRYITGMDRGIITEFKLWEEEDGVEEIRGTDHLLHDNVFCTYVEILPTDQFYNEAVLKAQREDDNFTIREDGKVFKWSHFKFMKVRGRIIRVGWRHTLTNLASAGIPGVDKRALEIKFNIDLSLKPIGPDAGAAFTEE